MTMMLNVPIVLMVACLLGVVVLVVAAVAAAAGRRRPAGPAGNAPGAGNRARATPEELARLVQSRQDRFREERQRILQMVHAGRISAGEGDRLLDTLERETTTRGCPFCGGEIHVSAVKCKHCRRLLVASEGRSPRLVRSSDRMLAGVCGGVAAHLGLDPSLVRILAVVVALVTGLLPALLAYLVMALILPTEP